MKEMEALMSMRVFRKVLSSLRNAREKGYQFAPLQMIFDVKVDLRRKPDLFWGATLSINLDTRYMQEP